jgi:hypothetical protein
MTETTRDSEEYLVNILIEKPNMFRERAASEGEILSLMKTITGFRVMEEFEDDHVPCFRTEITIDGKTYKQTFYWAGEECRRTLYQSEISQAIRDTLLKVFLAEKLENDLENGIGFED